MLAILQDARFLKVGVAVGLDAELIKDLAG